MKNLVYAEMTAQAKVNLMENLFEQGEVDKAWERLESFQQESRGEVYDVTRHQWESRMNYLASRILLQRNEIDRAEGFILENLEKVRRVGSRKREGSLLRLMGEVNLRHKKVDQAVAHISKAIAILQKVGNPRQLWGSPGRPRPRSMIRLVDRAKQSNTGAPPLRPFREWLTVYPIKNLGKVF